MVTWQTLTRLCPELRDLERDALGAHRPGPPDWRTWESIKQRLGTLIGWWAKHPVDPRLASGEAWKLCYGRLLYCWELGTRPDAKPKGADGLIPTKVAPILSEDPDVHH